MAQVPIIEYFKPLRPVITIRDKNNDPTYVYHDSFHPPEPSSGSPSIYYCDVDLAYGQAGTFILKINDPERQLDSSKIGLGNKVWIQAGRDENNLFNLFSGVCRSCKPIRQNYNLLGYELSGFGTQIIMNERVVNFLRTSLRDPANPNKPFVLDPNMTANKLFNVLMTANDIIPLFFPALKHTLHAGMFDTTSKIEANVDTFIASLTEPYVEASQVANSIADMAGAIWGVEPQGPGEPDKVFLRFPSTFHSGTVIKDRPESPEEYTNKNISYLRAATGGFSFVDSMRKEDGFTNRIFSKTGAETVTGGSQSEDQSTALGGIDIAQQFTVNSTVFRDLAFTLHVEGNGEWTRPPSGGILWSPANHFARIVNDEGGRPGSIVEVAQEQPLKHLENGKTTQLFMQMPPGGAQLRTLKPGDKAWIIFLQNAVIRHGDEEPACGSPLPDFSIYWHHDGGNTGVSAIRTVCNQAQPAPKLTIRQPTREDTTTGWVINNAGPTYSHTFFDSFSHIIEASDQQSIDKYGEVDSFIDASFLTDENSMNQYLSSILQYAAKPRRIYEFAEVFIPYNSPIEPGSLVTIIDSISGHTQQRQLTAEVQEVRYEFAADAAGNNPLGTHTCEVRLLGYVDYREQSVIAVSEQSLEAPIVPPGQGNPPPPPPPPPPPATELDTDGIKILMPINNAQGKFHRNMVGLPNLGASTWTSSTYFKHDCQGNSASKNTSGSLTYWTMQAREGTFASTGNTNYTCRPTWVSDSMSTPAGLTGAKNRGYLATANDPKNIEFTAIVRVKQIEDLGEEATFKWCGDTHTDTSEKTLQGMSKFPYRDNEQLFAFEKTHPSDRRADVTFVSPFTSNNYPKVSQNVWRGIKTIVYNINNNQGRHVEWWIDEDPIDPAGGFKNNWKKIAIYEEQRSDTPTWGGPHNTLRTDMAHEVDLAAFNIHEIIPPGASTTGTFTAIGQTATPELLAEKAEYEESTGMQHPDYISEMIPIVNPLTPDVFESSNTGGSDLGLNAEIESITGTEAGATGTLTPKTIARESEPIDEQIDEIDQTFGNIDMSGVDP